VPDSLCAKVLKARYFKDNDIMSATCPTGRSFTWRSIMHGRDLLRPGLIWHIGDGACINVYHDNWIPIRGSLSLLGASFNPLGASLNPHIHRVSNLLNEHGDGWDEAKLSVVLSESEMNEVKKIAVGGRGTGDYRVCGTIRKTYASQFGRSTT
jgi:hypothetical protein